MELVCRTAGHDGPSLPARKTLPDQHTVAQAGAKQLLKCADFGYGQPIEGDGCAGKEPSDSGAAVILGNSPEIVRKHDATWSPARQARIDELMEGVHTNVSYAENGEHPTLIPTPAPATVAQMRVTVMVPVGPNKTNH